MAPSPIVLWRAYGTVWDGLGGGGSWHPHCVGYGWEAMTVFTGGLSGYPWETYRAVILPASPLCYLLVCVRILMVDRPSANKLRRSMSSPRHLPAHHPPLFHAYTFSRAGSFVQARVPWTRSAPLLFACCPRYSLPLPSTLSLLETTAHAHTPQPHGHSIKHAPHHCHHPTPAFTAAHGLFPMDCAASLLHNSPHGLLWHALTISCRPALQTTFTPPHMNILN